MDGVRVISSLAVFLFLLLASFSAAREERLVKKAWKAVALGDYPFLALVECGDPAVYYSGSILSETKVLSYCACDDAKKTSVYAGLIKKGDQNAQKRTAQLMDPHPTQANLKIFTVEKWNFSKNVSAVDLPPKSRRGRTGKQCKVVGFGQDGTAVRMMPQTIGSTECGKTATDGLLYSEVPDDTTKLGALDQGGPAVCSDALGAINVKGEKKQPEDGTKHCNEFIDVNYYRDWIDGQIKEGASGGPGGPGGPGGSGGSGGSNNSTASSGYSIHSYLNKYSNWKVLWFLVPTIVTFLQY